MQYKQATTSYRIADYPVTENPNPMSHSLASIDALIREGTSLKKKIGMIARNLEDNLVASVENFAVAHEKEIPACYCAKNNIEFLTPLTCGLERTVSDIFSMICNFDGVAHGGIYVLNRRQRQLDLVCHFNMRDELLAGMVRFGSGSWQVNAAFESLIDFDAMERVPMHEKIGYEQCGIDALALIPLIHHGKVVGCMNLTFHEAAHINGFAKLVIECLAERISRAIALHLAQVKLARTNEGLNGLMSALTNRFQLVGQPSEPEPINGFFAGMKDEIIGLCLSISMASEKIRQKMKDGQRRRELPFVQKKVDAILNDIDLVVRIFNRLRIFCNSQSTMLEQGMLYHISTTDDSFLGSMADFYHALEVLVREEWKHATANEAFLSGNYKMLNRPVKLTDLKIRINRLTPN